jgi:hypothetical protein
MTPYPLSGEGQTEKMARKPVELLLGLEILPPPGA